MMKRNFIKVIVVLLMIILGAWLSGGIAISTNSVELKKYILDVLKTVPVSLILMMVIPAGAHSGDI